MTLTFVTNFVHHHQLPLADEFYRLIGDNYRYVATMELPDWLIQGGYDPTLDRPYIVRTYLSVEEMKMARTLIDSSDVVIYGAAPDEWVYKRKCLNMVTFHFSERWLRKIDLHAIAPRALYNIYRNYFRFRHKRTYMLCASAFTARDVHRYGCFPGRCFKWGYITKVESSFQKETLQSFTPAPEGFSIMWCARFLKLKHPELPVQLAARLKARGYRFILDMFGSGKELEKTRSLISELGVKDCVHLCGNRPNEKILSEMRKHRIFLFTSDRNEGWGAVLNEAMSSGCVPVASSEIGSVPYLVKSGYNGMIFDSKSLDSLEQCVCSLLDHPEQITEMSNAAVDTMRKVWSPQVAARNFLELAQYAQDNRLDEYSRKEGPASWDE